MPRISGTAGASPERYRRGASEPLTRSRPCRNLPTASKHMKWNSAVRIPVAVSDAFRTRFDALSGQLRYLPRTGRLIWEATRGWSVAWVAILVLLGLSPLATVTLT